MTLRLPVPEHIAQTLADLLKTDDSGYMLRMFWLGRADKISNREMPALEWLTRTFLPEQLVDSFQGFVPGAVCFPGVNHQDLAREVMVNARRTSGPAEPGAPDPIATVLRGAATAAGTLFSPRARVDVTCWCETCDMAANNGWRSRMSVCNQCGDKRCPRASQHDNDCRAHPAAPNTKDDPSVGGTAGW